MRIYKLFGVSLVFLLIIGSASAVFAIEFPKATGYVNDFAGVLLPHEKSELEVMLKTFEDQTSNQIFVVITSTFDSLDRFAYSQQLFNKWEIGQKERNNGILFLWGPSPGLPFPERGEVFVNVGPGLEGALPDSLVGTILRQEVFPNFKKQQYMAGLRAGLTAIMQATKGEYKGEPERNRGSSGTVAGMANFLIFLGFLFVNYFLSFLARTKSWWLGGVMGAVGGVLLGFLLFSGLTILFMGLGFGGFGLLFDYFLSKNYQQRKAAGKPTDFWHSGGGFGGFSGGGGGFSRGGGAGGGY